MRTGRRGELFGYLAILALNLLVLPNWFSPGRFGFGTRLGFIGVSAAIIAFCAWRITGILGVSPFSKVKRPTFAPYRPAPGEDDAGEGTAAIGLADAGEGASPIGQDPPAEPDPREPTGP